MTDRPISPFACCNIRNAYRDKWKPAAFTFSGGRSKKNFIICISRASRGSYVFTSCVNELEEDQVPTPTNVFLQLLHLVVHYEHTRNNYPGGFLIFSYPVSEVMSERAN